jgi:hypothetical protein
MAITEDKNAFINTAAQTFSLSQMFGVTASGSNPTYLVLTALDRNEYTAGATGATGSLSGNGNTATFSSIGGDGRGTGIVFTYQASTGRYYNSTYGYFDQLSYKASASKNDVTSLSLYGTNSLATANAYATNVYDMMQADPSGYLGSVTVATQPSFTGAVPSQATPYSIAATADSFVGDAWNMNGCWVLASTIAAEAGASLPVASTAIGLPGQANGEWIVAFNGPAGQTGNWQSMVKEGEIVVIGTGGGGGHITTVVSGSGSNAMLVDNITYEYSNGQIANSANDGSVSDVIVAAPHLASQEWANVSSSSTVVIYELDTPVVSNLVASSSLGERASEALATLFAAADPAGKAITEWQVYDTATSDALVVGGSGASDHTAATALTVASLASVSLLAGSSVTTDTLEVRAYNGTYWGDWDSLSVSVTASGAASATVSAPVVTAATANQTWNAGAVIDLVLPATTFHDPQGQALAYTAHLSSGQALPSWLSFNAATDTFTGTAPTAAQTLNIVVTATDTSGLSASETFNATVIGTPVVAAATTNQTWTEGQAISLTLPGSTFTDPQNQALTYSATLANGQALPSWLTFHPATDSFTGTAPTTAQSLSIKVTATDTSGLSTSETFAASVQPAVARPSIAVSTPTANQVWTDGQAVNFVLPGNTFTDALGLPMTFTAFEVSGPNVTSWLRFNPVTDAFSGAAPANASGTIGLAVVAMDAAHVSAVDLFSVSFQTGTGHASTAAMPLSVAGLAAQFVTEPPSALIGFHS